MRRHRDSLAHYAGYAALSLIAVAVGCASPDIHVEGIEVTQAIQDTAQSVQLVSQRATAVRVRVGTASGGSAAGVDGALRVFVDGAEVTPVGGVAPINTPFTAPDSASWDRDQQDHTLNFELAAPSGIVASSDVDFVVDLDPLPNEPDTTNNQGRLDDLSFEERISPQLYFTRINYIPAGAGLPALADVEPGMGDSFVQGIYPVDDSDPDLYREGLFPTLTWSQDPNGNGQIDSGGEVSDILDWLESCRQLIVDADGGSGDDIFLYGWVEDNPIPSNGWANTGGRIAFGNTQHIRHQRTYAHELGHNFGLSHNSRTLDPDTGWDTGGRLDGNPATNNTTGRVKITTLNDIMVGGQLTDSAWVDPTTYDFFLSSPVIAPGGGGPDERRSLGVVAVSGVLDDSGRELVRLNPTFRYPWPSEASQPFDGGEYLAVVTDVQGTTYETTFSGVLGDDARDSEEIYGFFAVAVEVPAALQIAEVSVIRREDERVLGTLRRSAPPAVRLERPSAGDTLAEEVEVRFSVSDSDTPLSEVRLQFAYSSDGGTTWVPVAVNVPGTETSVVVDSRQVQNTLEQGAGAIRAFASDGLNTVFDEVTGLTVERGRPR